MGLFDITKDPSGLNEPRDMVGMVPIENELTKKLVDYLDCPCHYFPSMTDDGPIMAAYRAARERGKRDGFVPMLVAAEDANLIEEMFRNAGSDLGETPEKSAVAAWRKTILASPLEDFQRHSEAMQKKFRRHLEMAEELKDLSAEPEPAAESLSAVWGFRRKRTIPLILAEIPVKEPWEVFAYLPFGGWNDCPDTLEQMSAAKSWYERYQAEPAIITHDTLEFCLPSAVAKEESVRLAREMYLYCGDIVDQGIRNLGALADILSRSTVWYFWWD